MLTNEKILGAIDDAPAGGLKLPELAERLGLDAKGRHRLRGLVQELIEEGTLERAPGARYQRPGTEEAAPAARRPERHPLPTGPRPGWARPAPPQAAPPAAVPTPPAAVRALAPTPAHAPTPPPTREAAPGDVLGSIRVHPAGYGFVARDDGEPDVFVPARFRGHALDGDRVRLSTWLGVKGTEGRVEEVVQRGRSKLTGTIKRVGRTVVLEPDDPRIAATWGHVTLDEGGPPAHDGVCVVAEITEYPAGDPSRSNAGTLRARVMHVLGDSDDPRTEVAKVIAIADIPDVFPEDVLAAALRTSQEVGPADLADRVDLRDRAFLTIDPETARDFDDAICLEPRGAGWRVWVAVADVSHYVVPGGALDREARVRSFSVYLPDRAIPMLPKELSSGICSLNPEVDRCAMVVRLDLDAGGVVLETAFVTAVIRSRARLDYPGVGAALAGDFRGTRARYREWLDVLKRMDALAKLMRARRRLRGALELDLPEAKVLLDEDDPRRVRDVRQSKADPEVKGAYQLVEEYMLAANEASARFFAERQIDCVYRVHAPPAEERLEAFGRTIEAYGLKALKELGASTARELGDVLTQVSDKPFARALHFLLLRSLKQAVYDIVNVGHFGLASPAYLHFTSPIRRYPDLVVHRLMKQQLRKEGLPAGGGGGPVPSQEDLIKICAESSALERRAAQAEREVVDMYRAFLMRDRVGEELDGEISGVTSFGVFVEIKSPFVEGMIKLEHLPGDSWELDEVALRLVARRSGRALSLGDVVKVRLESVSVARRRLELALVEGGRVLTAEERSAAADREQESGRRRKRRDEDTSRKRVDRDPDRGRPRAGGGGGRPGGGGRGAELPWRGRGAPPASTSGRPKSRGGGDQSGGGGKPTRGGRRDEGGSRGGGGGGGGRPTRGGLRASTRGAPGGGGKRGGGRK